jgi:hypothetical protein
VRLLDESIDHRLAALVRHAHEHQIARLTIHQGDDLAEVVPTSAACGYKRSLVMISADPLGSLVHARGTSHGLAEAAEAGDPVRCDVLYDARRRLRCRRMRGWYFGDFDGRTAVAALKSHALERTAKFNNAGLGLAAFATEWSNHDQTLL